MHEKPLRATQSAPPPPPGQVGLKELFLYCVVFCMQTEEVHRYCSFPSDDEPVCIQSFPLVSICTVDYWVAHFHSSEKEPVDKDKLMILVIIGRRDSMQLTTNGAGIRSSLQIFFAQRSINMATSFSDCWWESVHNGEWMRTIVTGCKTSRQSRSHVVWFYLDIDNLL